MPDSKRMRAAVAHSKSRAAKWRPFKRDDRDPATRRGNLGGGECWCGEEFGHDWPGKVDGAPHPRD